MYQRLLVPLDGSEQAEYALEYAAELSQRIGAQVTLFHVCAPTEHHLQQMHEGYLAHQTMLLKDLLNQAGVEGTRVDSMMVFGDPATEILGYANENNVDLIAMTTHGRSNISRWLMGSVADKVVRHSRVPVRLVKSSVPGGELQRHLPEKEILVLLDGSPIAEQALPHVVTHAKMFDAEVTLLRVCESPIILADYPEGIMELSWEAHVNRITERDTQECRCYVDNLSNWLETQGVKSNTETLSGSPAEEIARYIESRAFDLIALTTHGRSGVTRWAVGSVAQKILQATSIPLLLVRASPASLVGDP